MNETVSFPRRLAIGLLPALTGIAIPFLHLYLLNTEELSLPVYLHLPGLALISGVLTALAVAVQSIGPPRARRVISLILLSWGILIWGDATLFIGHFGFLQGAELDWSQARHLLYLEIVLLAVVAGVLVRRKEALLRHAPVIVTILCVSSLANLYPAWQQARSAAQPEPEHTFNRDGVFDLSANQNVLLFILDTFQSDLFAEIVTRNPQWQDQFAGFTYFPNATSAFPKTYASVPNILSGEAFDNSRPFSEYLRKAMRGNSLPRVLKKEGYDVRVQSFAWPAFSADPEVFDNLSDVSSASERAWMQRHEYTELLNLTLFRSAPFLAKPWVYNDNKFRIRERALLTDDHERSYQLTGAQRKYSTANSVADLQSLDRWLAFVTAQRTKPALRIFHYNGVHEPLVLDHELKETAARGPDREEFLDQAEGMLAMIGLEFDRLRELGILDDSLILVVGDHGAGEFHQAGVRAEALQALGIAAGITVPNGARERTLVQGGIPLVLIKRPRSTGHMQTNAAPVELSDVPNTVFRELGLDRYADGPSVFDIDPAARRIRLHRFYSYSGWGQDYIVPLTEYRVDGFSWDRNAWAPTGRNLNREAVSAVDGVFVVFGEGGNLDEFEHSGWGPIMPQGRRIAGGRAEIRLPLPDGLENPQLELRMNTGWADDAAEPMRVIANGKLAGIVSISRRARNQVELNLSPVMAQSRDQLELVFQMDDPMGEAPLMIELRAVAGAAAPDYALGDTLHFTTESPDLGYLDQGWWPSEPWGTWSREHMSGLRWRMQEDRRADLQVDVDCSAAVFSPESPLRVEVWANGSAVAEWEIHGAGPKVRAVRVPAALLEASGAMSLVFAVQNPRSPLESGRSGDPRSLGLGLRSVVVHDWQLDD